MTEKLIPLGSVMDALIEECMAKGMSRRAATRFVRKIVEDKWKAGELDIYGRRTDGKDEYRNLYIGRANKP